MECHEAQDLLSKTESRFQGLDHVAENVLSFLDARSLCAAELVSKEWLRVISEVGMYNCTFRLKSLHLQFVYFHCNVRCVAKC